MELIKCEKKHSREVISLYQRTLAYLEAHVNYPKWDKGHPSDRGVFDAIENGAQYICLHQGEALGALVLIYIGACAVFMLIFYLISNPVLDRCMDQTGTLFAVTLSEVERNVEQMVDFVAEHSRVFRIVQSGPPEHYAAFLDRFADRVSQALGRYAQEHCAKSLSGIANPDFFHAAGQSFVSVLRLTLEHCEDREKTVRYLRELLRFQFGCFEERLQMAGRIEE